MPLVKIKHIISFSSEELKHRAENLCVDDTTRKWKCTAGEKSASVVLQLEKSTQISSIDIGNEGSAFIEVLVGRSHDNTVQYQVILVASSFMSPQESRTGTSPSRVRIFRSDKLVQDIAAQRWDIVKVVCTQPFSKRVPYGLSFIKLHTLEDDEIEHAEQAIAVPKKTEKEGSKRNFGGFKLKEEKDIQSVQQPGVQMYLHSAAKKENLNIGMWEMQNCRTMDEAKKLIAEKQAQKEAKRRSHSPEIKKEIEEKRRKIDRPSSTTHAKSTPVKFSNLKNKKTTPQQHSRKDQVAADESSSKKSTRKSEDPSRASKSSRVVQQRPYNRILDGVIFVLSGFQNPLRATLRDKALGMGAQYRKDWTPDSTHLICAFPNTPKYRQVIGCGGKIVKKEWIDECASRKQRAPWRVYSMNPNQSDSSSEEEEFQAQTAATRVAQKSSGGGDAMAKEQKGESEDEDPYGGSTDEGGDTEDEIERVKTQSVGFLKPNGKKEENEDEIYNASTDEEADGSEDGDVLPPLPDYLAEKHFFLYGDFPTDRRRLIVRHIVTCGGKLLPYMNDEVEYVVTEQHWDRKFDKALTDNAGLVFVRPSWLFQCGSQQQLVPYQPHVVSPL